VDDQTTTLGQLRAIIKQFVDQRDWGQFHNPKNLSMAITIEAAELMEHFQWLRTDELDEVTTSAPQMAQIREELADVVCFVLSLANELAIDVSAAVEAKVEKNRRKYPAERFRGRFK